MAVRKKAQRKLCVESLEHRTMLDGTVWATLDPRTGILAITGDARDNGVEITTEEIDGAWQVKVAGTASTWIATRSVSRGTKVNRAEWVSFPAADVKGVAIDMKHGRNSVWLEMQAGPEGGNFVLPKDFSFQSGKDLDCLSAAGLDVMGSVKIITGAGGDTVVLGTAIENEETTEFIPFNVAGKATIDLGRGNNSLELRGLVGKDLSIASATGKDSVVLAGRVDGNLSVNLGPNQDVLVVSPLAEIPGPPTAARIGGNASINLGDGDNTLAFFAQVGQNLTVNGGKHGDTFLIGSGGFVPEALPVNAVVQEEFPPGFVAIQGNVNLDSGAGNDSIYLVADVGGSVSVKTGNGIDAVILAGTIQGKAAIDTGADSDWVDFQATAANVEIKTGSGNDVVWVYGPAVGGNLSIDTGAENDSVLISTNVAGNVSVKTGDGDDSVTIGRIEDDDGGEEDGDGGEAEPLAMMDAGSSSTPGVIQGSLLIDTGAGDDEVIVANVLVGAASPSLAANTMASLGGDVRILLGDGGELFANPNGESDVPYLATESVRIWGLQASGKLLIDGGNGDNAIGLLQSSAAHVDVVNGAGNSLIAIGQLDLGGRGNLAIKNGPGDHGIFIGTRFGWNEFFPIEDAVGFGVAAASVTIQSSSLYSGQVTIEDSNIDKSLAIQVKGGDVRIALCNVQGLPMAGGFGRVAQVAIQTDAGDDEIEILPRMAETASLRADRVSIATGQGNDAVAINALEADQALASLGAGDDLLQCGDLTAIATAVMDGGPGKRDRYDGPLFPSWVFANFEEMPS